MKKTLLACIMSLFLLNFYTNLFPAALDGTQWMKELPDGSMHYVAYYGDYMYVTILKDGGVNEWTKLPISYQCTENNDGTIGYETFYSFSGKVFLSSTYERSFTVWGTCDIKSQNATYNISGTPYPLIKIYDEGVGYDLIATDWSPYPEDYDSDSDGFCDPGKPSPTCRGSDNCPINFNPDQKDSDNDGVGDVCDNCWEIFNPDQHDSDADCLEPPYTSDPRCGDLCETVCGDNVKEGSEVCDGEDLGGETCETQGYSGGVLSCLSDCSDFERDKCIGPHDSDGDGIPDDEDNCPESNLEDTITIGDCDSGVKNQVFSDGCTMSDMIAECESSDDPISCVFSLTGDWWFDGFITFEESNAIFDCAFGVW